MNDKLAKQTGGAKALSPGARLVLAAVLAAAVAAGALALFQPSASPAGSSAAVSNAGAPGVSSTREMFEQHEFLAKRSESAAATRRQEELKDQWLERRGAPNEVEVPLSRERAEEHAWLAQRKEAAEEAAAADRHWREMKARGGMGNSSQVSPCSSTRRPKMSGSHAANDLLIPGQRIGSIAFPSDRPALFMAQVEAGYAQPNAMLQNAVPELEKISYESDWSIDHGRC
jgi:hypothetical protein